MIVVDAGAWARALASTDEESEAARRILVEDDRWVMPAHGVVETIRTIRRLEARDYLSEDESTEIVNEICHAEVITVPPEPWLLKEIWALRQNVSPYDAAYLVLARHFECVLVTFDKRLARAAAQYGVDATVPGTT